MSGWVQARTVVETKDVETAKDEAAQKYPRFEEMWIGLTWLLARQGVELSQTHKIENGEKYYLYKAKSIGRGCPDIVVIYTADEEQVIIHGMQATGQVQQQTATITEFRPNPKAG